MQIDKNKILKIFKNKYFLALVFFLFWLSFFDRNNLLDRVVNINKLKKLEQDKEYFLEQKRADSIRVNELNTNNDNLEKFAREQYLMKKDNEDIFIIVEEDEE